MAEKTLLKVPLKTIQEADERKGYDEALHARFISWKDQSGNSLSRIAAMLSRSVASVSQYISKTYPADVAALERDIEVLLRREEDLEFVEAPEIFCNTKASILMWEVLQYCDRRQRMGLILAPSGTGKSEACREYKRKNRMSLLVTASMATRSMGSILRLIAKHSGGTPRRNSLSDLLDAIVDRLKGSRRLVIIDDAHFLSWEAFELVRKIHDCAGVGVVYAGQERLYEQMKEGVDKDRLYDQIYSRVAIKRDTFQITKKDVKLIAGTMIPGLDGDCIDYLYRKARGKGKFRIMKHLTEMMLEMHQEFGKPIGLDLLREADRFLMI